MNDHTRHKHYIRTSVLPESRRRVPLKEAFDRVLTRAFKHRILVFDEAAAHFYG